MRQTAVHFFSRLLLILPVAKRAVILYQPYWKGDAGAAGCGAPRRQHHQGIWSIADWSLCSCLFLSMGCHKGIVFLCSWDAKRALCPCVHWMP